MTVFVSGGTPMFNNSATSVKGDLGCSEMPASSAYVFAAVRQINPWCGLLRRQVCNSEPERSALFSSPACTVWSIGNHDSLVRTTVQLDQNASPYTRFARGTWRVRSGAISSIYDLNGTRSHKLAEPPDESRSRAGARSVPVVPQGLTADRRQKYTPALS